MDLVEEKDMKNTWTVFLFAFSRSLEKPFATK
jgi:hypothetical protein